jgi:threonine-phosphate decarboxylase
LFFSLDVSFLYHDVEVHGVMNSYDHGGNVREISRIYGIDENRLFDFSASINPLGYPQGIKDRTMGAFDTILHYPDTEAYDLITRLADYHGMDRECFIAGSGSTEFIYWIPFIFKPKRALVVTPAFSEYEKGLRLAGSQVMYFQADEERDFVIDMDNLYTRLTDGFDILYFCNPANPTGVLTPKEELFHLIARAERLGTIVIIDEAFIDFVEEASLKVAAMQFPHCFILRSMTKFFGIPGLRVGYAIAGSAVIERLKRDKPPWMINTLAQICACEVLSDSAFIQETRRYVETERGFLHNAINGIPGLKVFPGAANYLLVRIDFRMGLSSRDLRERLLREGILIRDCSNFQRIGNYYFRVAVRKHGENQLLIDKLKIVMA